ncbi:unnamed protein product [Didymodactylos carnosus]|uniref:Uncharacterized protein n=1 Tax=Didymodactylos carnosus TaxID=1234261 RepID=A0A8S2LFP8_9BILA|nr:unnamed protein product [Didymodactylos carnosus]CAF3898064.1 unnamed protein product [Didymodactylos carnosus]
MTIQMTIDRHYLLTKKQYLSKLPERLLIKNSQQNPEIFITPNSTISLENLFLNENDTGNVVTYKLMAIICGNNPDMMFYREPTTDYWYFYRNEAEQATLSVRLSDENKKLLDSLIQEEIHPITNLYAFDKSLATIFTTPQFYVYQPVI